MTFEKFANFLALLEQTSSRLKITEILADLLKQADSKEIDKICYLSLGQLAPLYAGIEFNLAEKMMIRVIGQAFGVGEEEVKREYKKVGDLGEVGYGFKVESRKSKVESLSVTEVYERLLEMAQEGGAGSVERKIGKMAQLLRELAGFGVKYAVRIPLGRLRLGFSELTLMDALSWMLVKDKSVRETIEEAFNVRADIGQIAKELKVKSPALPAGRQKSKVEKIVEELTKIKPQVGIPVMPALCQRLPTADQMIEKMAPRGIRLSSAEVQARGKVAVEPKFDGTRLAVHFRRPDFIRLFTRNLENVTHMFPDIIEATDKEIKAKEVILDGEAIGYDPKTGKFLPFQETIKRKRKYEISAMAKQVPLKFYCFDILYKDGKDLLKQPFEKRRNILEKILPSSNKTIILTPQIVTDNPQDLRQYHDEQKEKGLEGVVVKKWLEPYDPGRRGYTWVKFKEEETKKGGGLADTLDCVVMGYYKGKGKRAGFGIGAFLIGIRESENSDRFLTISKIGTGLSDEQWRELKVKSEKLKSASGGKSKPKQYLVDKNLEPDVWCNPVIVVEVKADNITISPIHTAGLALRFPRLVRFRDLKSPDQATTLAETKKLYRLQK